MSMENNNQPRRRFSSIIKYILISVLLVLLAALPVYYVLSKRSVPKQDINTGLANYVSTQSTGPNTTTTAFKPGDTVSVPGPSCNTNTPSWWSVGTRYKTVMTPTPTIGQTNPSLNETPTPVVVDDKSTVATCQNGGLYVQHTSHYDSFAEVFFQGDAQEALAQHFSTQITASALNPSSAATFTLGVRHQNRSTNNDDGGYGDDLLLIGVDGSWQSLGVNNVTDQYTAPFTKGYVKPSSTMTLGAEVNGPRITFSINNQQITTIVDTTFPSGYAIGFGLSDKDAKSPPSALYSNFSYQPLTGTSLTAQSAIATATVQANKDLHTKYTATIPGLGCDHGLGQWQSVRYATASCQPHGLAISQSANTRYSGDEAFDGLDGKLPTNYTVKVQIDTSRLSNGDAGLVTRADTQAGGYNFVVFYNGYWIIQRYNSNGKLGPLLAQGFVNPQTSYIMIATSNRDVQSLSLNGVTVATVHDATLHTTDHISLTMYAGQGKSGTALFSNFVFTPLS